VWHDDAQGTGCVVLAGLLNALKVAGKKLNEVRIVFQGAGAANSTSARLVLAAGADPGKVIMFDVDGALTTKRTEFRDNKSFAKIWDLCQKTNPGGITDFDQAVTGADVIIGASAPGTIKPEHVKKMAPKSVIFACANPVPEIYPSTAKEAGAYIVATGRGDFSR